MDKQTATIKQTIPSQENLQKQIDFYNRNDRFCQYDGIQLVELGLGYAVSELTITEKSLNFMGSLHGGLICALADLTAGKAALSYGLTCVTVNISTNCIKGCKSGKIRATATEVSRGRTTCVYRVDVTDQTGRIVAISTSTLFITGQPIDFDK